MWRHFEGVARFAGLLLCLLGISAMADEEDCDALSPTEQPACWMTKGCVQLTDEAAREECLAKATELRETLAAAGQDDAKPSVSVSAESTPVSAPPTPSASESTPVTATNDAAAREQRGFIKRFVRRQEYDIPRRFTGVVTRQRDLVYDRQLIVVDDELLFEGENAEESSLSPGDEVDVRRTSRFYGHSYRITGPSRRAVPTRRIRCEADASEQSVDTRRKCQFIGDGSD